MNAATARPRILVTGASRGIGRAIARQFFTLDYEVALCARSESGLRETASMAGLARGVAKVLPCDLSRREASDAAIGALVQEWGSLRGLVLAHALNVPTPLSGHPADFERMIEADLISPLRLLRQLAPAVEDGGRIVLIGSVLARFGVPGLHGYCASKTGLAGLARALALDLAPRRITVNCLLPGWTDTDMAREGIKAQCGGMGMSPEEARAFFENQLPLKRFLSADEIAAHVMWLFSPGAAGYTGQVPSHDCGALA